jgi:hypothetical protein
VLPSDRRSALPLNRLTATVLGVGLGTGVWAVTQTGHGHYIPSIEGRNVLIAGAIVAIAFLATQVWLGIRALRGLRTDAARARPS